MQVREHEGPGLPGGRCRRPPPQRRPCQLPSRPGGVSRPAASRWNVCFSGQFHASQFPHVCSLWTAVNHSKLSIAERAPFHQAHCPLPHGPWRWTPTPQKGKAELRDFHFLLYIMLLLNYFTGLSVKTGQNENSKDAEGQPHSPVRMALGKCPQLEYRFGLK